MSTSNYLNYYNINNCASHLDLLVYSCNKRMFETGRAQTFFYYTGVAAKRAKAGKQIRTYVITSLIRQ